MRSGGMAAAPVPFPVSIRSFQYIVSGLIVKYFDELEKTKIFVDVSPSPKLDPA